ncbi:MAG: hypothetical protein WGN25_16490 [Candidatus Electrothrix sp. GW3-4]|uniref:hypothetical protein n=1 Tax=Candidatus Electrothrix sp. GW3-4 TaxID=3126740 RepID=UPI0030CE6EDD
MKILFKSIVVIALMMSAAGSATAEEVQSIVQSPLGGIAVGPSGPASAVIYTQPYCCPSTALEVRANSVVGENDFQWVNFGLSLPIENNMNAISEVEVCYQIISAQSGSTYISQTRLTDMSTPDAATVKLDDGTDRTDLGPQCYVTNGNITPEGTITLALKVVFGDTEDAIIIGSTRLLF